MLPSVGRATDGAGRALELALAGELGTAAPDALGASSLPSMAGGARELLVPLALLALLLLLVDWVLHHRGRIP